MRCGAAHAARVPSCALLRSLCRLGIKSQVLEALRALCVAPASKEQVRVRTPSRCAELAAAVTLPCSNSSTLARHTACSCHPKSPSFATFCIAARALWNALLRSHETSQHGVLFFQIGTRIKSDVIRNNWDEMLLQCAGVGCRFSSTISVSTAMAQSPAPRCKTSVPAAHCPRRCFP